MLAYIKSDFSHFTFKIVKKQDEKNEAMLLKQKKLYKTFFSEMKSILTQLKQTTDVILEQPLGPELKEKISKIDMFSDLLFFNASSLQNGQTITTQAPITPTLSSKGLSHSVQTIWRLCSELIEKKGLKGLLKMAKGVPLQIKIDHDYLKTILYSLIINSINSTEKGLITMTVKWLYNAPTVTDKTFEPHPFDLEEEGVFEKDEAVAALTRTMSSEFYFMSSYSGSKFNGPSNRIIGPHFYQKKGVLKITITNTGCGIIRNCYKDPVEMYTDINSDSSYEFKIGVGLGEVQKICTSMGGELKVFCSEGQGSAYVLCLPGEISNED
jgi:light-regulated signal transduction histidine kinase (bacteriophytochrome)